jgi:hypothetical protein
VRHRDADVMIHTPPPATTGRPTYVAIVEYDGHGWNAEIPSLHIATHSTTVREAHSAVRDAIAHATDADATTFDVRTIVSYNRTSLD